MPRFLITILVFCLTFTFMFNAEARRFGGGRSFGFTSHSFSQPAGAGFGRPLTPPAFGRSATSSRWAGPLAGLAIGALLSALFLNIGHNIMIWLIVGGILLFVFRTIMQKRAMLQPQFQPSHSQPYRSSPMPSPSRSISFDEAGFLRAAKAQFLRLQTASDTLDIAAIRSLTTNEVFAEIQSQLQEHSETEVVQLDAQLLRVADAQQDLIDNEYKSTIASVYFSGLIRETKGAAAAPFSETWYFREAWDSSHWVVAGIQQN